MIAFAAIMLVDDDWIPATVIIVAALVGLVVIAADLQGRRRPPTRGPGDPGDAA